METRQNFDTDSHLETNQRSRIQIRGWWSAPYGGPACWREGGSERYLWNAHCGLRQARVRVGAVGVSLGVGFKCTFSEGHHGLLEPGAWPGPLPHGGLRARLTQVRWLGPPVIVIQARSPFTFAVRQTLLWASTGPCSSRRHELEWIIQRGAAGGSLEAPLEVTVLAGFAQWVQVCVIICRKPGSVGLQRLHLRIIGLPVLHLQYVPILPGRVAAFIKRLQIISIETLFSVLFRCIVSSGVRFAGILREGEKAVFFSMAWTTAGGALVWGGWAFLPQGVGAGHGDVVKILQQAVDGGLLAGFVSSNDCLGIIKGTLFKENISHFQPDGRILFWFCPV